MQTAIRKIGSVECPKCGAANIVDVKEASGYARCECGHFIQYAESKATIGEVFALFGYELSVDYDGELLVESERDLSEPIRKWLFEHQGAIRQTFEFARRKAQSQFIGGMMNGQKHGHSRSRLNNTVCIHIARAHWEVYEFRENNDMRLWFVGRATSQTKARRRILETHGD